MESLVISNEMYQRRKHIHLFTMASQLFAFAIEVFFMGVVLIYRVLGRRFFLWNRLNKVKACKKVVIQITLLTIVVQTIMLIIFTEQHNGCNGHY